MWPIGPLMHEHRLIERMVAQIKARLGRDPDGSGLDAGFVAGAVDFFRNYADRCHHGKEEDILFRELARIGLEPGLAAIMAELTEEHRRGRRLVGDIERAQLARLRGDESIVPELVHLLKELTGFYPVHIEKEDKRFFFPVMELFDGPAKQAMLEEFADFDRQLIHEIYRKRVEGWETGGDG